MLEPNLCAIFLGLQEGKDSEARFLLFPLQSPRSQ